MTRTVTLAGFMWITVFCSVALLAACIERPVAEFQADISTGVAPLTVTFTNHSTNGEVFTWDLGDGGKAITTDVSESVTHEYKVSSKYMVILTASFADGSLASKSSTTITVRTGPLADIVLNKTGELRLNSGEEFAFTVRPVDLGGNEVSGVLVSFESDPSAGVINGAGVFTATTEHGRYTNAIRIIAVKDSRTVSKTVSVIVESEF